jgi:hypothetical protein
MLFSIAVDEEEEEEEKEEEGGEEEECGEREWMMMAMKILTGMAGSRNDVPVA